MLTLYWTGFVGPNPGRDSRALRGVNVSLSPQEFQSQTGVSGWGGGPLPFKLLLPTKSPPNNSLQDRSQPLRSMRVILKHNPDIASEFPKPRGCPRGAPRPHSPSIKPGTGSLLLPQRRKEKKSWQFNPNKRSLKSISTATRRLLANRILISMLLFFF